MTDFEIRCSEKSIKEYVKLTMFGDSVKKALPMILCAALLTVVPIFGVIGFIVTNQLAMLIVTGCALLFDAAVLIFTFVVINKTAKKLQTAFKSLDGLVCSVSENEIILVRGNSPQKVIKWDEIEEITCGDTAYFLRTHSNALLILEKDAVLSGSLNETEELINKKISK